MKLFLSVVIMHRVELALHHSRAVTDDETGSENSGAITGRVAIRWATLAMLYTDVRSYALTRPGNHDHDREGIFGYGLDPFAYMVSATCRAMSRRPRS